MSPIERLFVFIAITTVGFTVAVVVASYLSTTFDQISGALP